MLLRWNKQNLKYIELIPTAESGPVEVKRPSLTLLPGVNEVTNDEWKLIKPHVMDSIAQGSLVVLEEKTQAYPGKPAEIGMSLVDLPAKTARKLIVEAFNPETLNLWLAKENRDEIRRAIKDRLEFLKLEEKPVEATDEDEPTANVVLPEPVKTAPSPAEETKAPKAKK